MPTIWELPDELWERIEPLLARSYPPATTGRPRADLRRVLDGIIYRMRSGVQWNQLPRAFGADSTVHGWFQRFAADVVLREIWAASVGECDVLGGVCLLGVAGRRRGDGKEPLRRGRPRPQSH